MDEGTDAVDMLKGNVYPLKLGYIGVICRSQADINNNKPIERHLRDEQAFFKNHSSYSSFALKMGIPFLAKRLNAVLMNHISATLPQLKKNVNDLLYAVQDELNSYGDTLSGNRDLQSMILLQVIDKFAQGFDDALEGRSTSNSTDELQGGSRINFIFEEIYRKTLAQIDPFDRMTDQDIRTAIRNASGTRSTLFVPTEAFENLVRRQIIKLKEPSLQCMQYIYDELSNNIYRIDIPELKRFDKFREELCNVVRELLNRRLTPTNEMIEKLIDVEYCYINTHHPDFMGGNEALQVAQNEIDMKSAKTQITEENKVALPPMPEKKKLEPKPKPKTANAGLSGWLFGGPKVIYT
jgi:replication fork clamp-binding protein CrfC